MVWNGEITEKDNVIILELTRTTGNDVKAYVLSEEYNGKEDYRIKCEQCGTVTKIYGDFLKTCKELQDPHFVCPDCYKESRLTEGFKNSNIKIFLN